MCENLNIAQMAIIVFGGVIAVIIGGVAVAWLLHVLLHSRFINKLFGDKGNPRL